MPKDLQSTPAEPLLLPAQRPPAAASLLKCCPWVELGGHLLQPPSKHQTPNSQPGFVQCFCLLFPAAAQSPTQLPSLTPCPFTSASIQPVCGILHRVPVCSALIRALLALPALAGAGHPACSPGRHTASSSPLAPRLFSLRGLTRIWAVGFQTSLSLWPWRRARSFPLLGRW